MSNKYNMMISSNDCVIDDDIDWYYDIINIWYYYIYSIIPLYSIWYSVNDIYWYYTKYYYYILLCVMYQY